MTTTVYLDESGDLGFDLSKTRTSRFFVVAALFCPDPKPVDKAVRKIFAGFTKTQVKARHGVLHAFKEDRPTNEKLLRLLASLDISIIVVRLDKTSVPSKQQADKHELYNQVVSTLLDRLASLRLVSADEPIHVIASQRETNAYLNEGFKSHIASSSEQRNGGDMPVTIAQPSAHKGLQAADCLAFSFYTKYEHADASYAAIVASRVVEESSADV
jgi:hypothetical protein